MEVQKRWDELGLIKKIQSKEGKDYWMLDGPPYPNAEPHLGHVRGLAFKDALLKMRSMQGRRVWIKPGFDCHGLPIENKIERQLGVKSKDDIENRIGTKQFMNECRKFATANVDIWMDFYKDMGIWFGWERPYYTLDFEYMDSCWWAVSELWSKGLLKVSKQPFHWCPHCQTVLSGYEVTDEYRELEDPSIFVKFPSDGFSFLVWTTTPWTLPGNVALVVRADADYVRVKVDGETEELVLAKKLLGVFDRLGKKYTVLETFKGEKLVGIKYRPVVECSAQKSLDSVKGARQVYESIPIMKLKVAGKIEAKKEVSEETQVGHFTNLDDGTGIVHCAPGHGPEDFEIGKHYSLKALSPVDESGKFTEDVELFTGKPVKEANDEVVNYLKEHNRLFHSEKVTHRYPVCWRCKTPLVFRMTEQWVIDIPSIKNKIIEAVEKVKWQPAFAKDRMLKWVSNAKEWTISRQRYWNIPMPVWRCQKGHVKVVSGAEELESLSGKAIRDLHRDSVDDVHFPCPQCGGDMSRIDDVLDVWFDSGAASFAVFGYPKNKSMFEKYFPSEWVEEGQDHIRGWFYYLLAMSVALFDKPPYDIVNMHGWVVDAKGEKMSKSKGNFVTARKALETLGPDVLRFYILSEAVPWETFRYQPGRAKEVVNKILVIWRNLNNYLVNYVELNPAKGKMKIEDDWLLSRLNTTIKNFREHFETYNLNKAMQSFRTFLVEDLSRTYMKLAKKRVKRGDSTPLWVIKQAHYKMMRLMAPFMPFITEEMYAEYAAKFGGKDSIYFEAYPEAEKARIDEKLEASFSKAMGLVEAVLAFRDEKGIGMKYPLPYVCVPKDLEPFASLIALLANCKETGQERRGVALKLGEDEIFVDGNLKEIHIQEGLMREVARRVQIFRKKRGMKASEKIELKLSGDDSLISAVKKFESDFRNIVGAETVNYTGGDTEFKISNKTIKIGI